MRLALRCLTWPLITLALSSLSAYLLNASQTTCLLFGAKNIWRKPIQLSDLREAVRAIIG